MITKSYYLDYTLCYICTSNYQKNDNVKGWQFQVSVKNLGALYKRWLVKSEVQLVQISVILNQAQEDIALSVIYKKRLITTFYIECQRPVCGDYQKTKCVECWGNFHNYKILFYF